MKETKLYTCEYCNTSYKIKEKAEQCEKNHKKPKAITNTRYLSYKSNNSGYPIEVIIKMEDGKEISYSR